MGAPKGHPNYNTSKDPKKNGGFFGRHEGTYSDELLHELGQGLVDWIQQEGNIYCKYFFAVKGILWPMVMKLGQRAPFFQEYLDAAKLIQESKLVSEPYDKTKNKDANHARFILARHHRGEFADQTAIVSTDGKTIRLEVDHGDGNSQAQVQPTIIPEESS